MLFSKELKVTPSLRQVAASQSMWLSDRHEKVPDLCRYSFNHSRFHFRAKNGETCLSPGSAVLCLHSSVRLLQQVSGLSPASPLDARLCQPRRLLMFGAVALQLSLVPRPRSDPPSLSAQPEKNPVGAAQLRA